MNILKRDGTTTFALRGKTLSDRVRSFSDDLTSRREALGVVRVPVEELSKDPDALAAVIAELELHGEELSVAEEELRAQLEEVAKLDARLDAQQLRYRELFEFAPDPSFVTDPAGMIREANESAGRALGLPPARLAGKPLPAFIDEEHVVLLRSALIALEPGATTTLDVPLRPRSGETLWVELRGFRSVEGDTVLWGARDVAERRRKAAALTGANEDLEARVARRTQELARALRDKEELLDRERTLRVELEVSNRAKDRFLAILSHDLRSPLNAVLGWTSLLRRELLDAPTRDRALATIERNARVQAELIEQLLDVSRITGGKLLLDMRGTDLGDVTRATLESILPTAQDKGVVLEDTSKGVAAPVLGDVSRLRQVVANLLTNAVKFTPRGGHVAIALDVSDGMARLSVEDTGQGIDGATLPLVFDCFRQAGDPTIRRAGLGLGLFIVRQIVELHGGRVDAESEGPGKGARFVVTLPLREGAATPPSIDPSISTLSLPRDLDLDGLRILLVEDEVDTRELLALALERYGARVVTAVDAETGFEVFRALTPDVIISDIGLPFASGNDLIRKVRAEESGPRVPALAVTGFVSESDSRDAVDAGFDAHIRKPVVPADLIHAIDRLTRGRVLVRRK